MAGRVVVSAATAAEAVFAQGVGAFVARPTPGP
jgi:hypothetical protein